ncbi:MAG: hypothetical protein K0S92_504 [Desertimonas sp.]|nr:hypothetical protein [Desertimonas sp.]
MTTPNVPVRFEFSIELDFTPEQVWQAIATGPGVSAWSMPTELDERAGGEYLVDMGEASSRGVVASWEPPHRLVVEEPEWAALAGHEGADVTPLVTEYLVEATSGGSCVLRVVSSAFGTGADWEREFMDDAAKYWEPQFQNLSLYLTSFPGQRATVVESGAELTSSSGEVLAAMRDRFGASAAGDSIDVHGIAGRVEKVSDLGLLVRYTEPECGFLNLMAYPNGETTSYALARVYLFGSRAAELAANQEAGWKEWFAELPAAVA